MVLHRINLKANETIRSILWTITEKSQNAKSIFEISANTKKMALAMNKARNMK